MLRYTYVASLVIYLFIYYLFNNELTNSDSFRTLKPGLKMVAGNGCFRI
jgi:hypothetical protein